MIQIGHSLTIKLKCMRRPHLSILRIILCLHILWGFCSCSSNKRLQGLVGAWKAIPTSLVRLSEPGLETKVQQLSLHSDGTATQYLVLRLMQGQEDNANLSDTVHLEYAVNLSGKWQVEGNALHLVFPPDEVSVQVLELRGAQLSTFLDTASQASIDGLYRTTEEAILDEWTKKLKAEAVNGVYWLEPIVRGDTLELTDRTLGVMHFVRTELSQADTK